MLWRSSSNRHGLRTGRQSMELRMHSLYKSGEMHEWLASMGKQR